MAKTNNFFKTANYLNAESDSVKVVNELFKYAINTNSYANNGKVNGGEVYTPHWTVVDMLNMVNEQIEDLDKTILDNCSGTGNFVIEVFRRRCVVILNSDLPAYSLIMKMLNNTYSCEWSGSSVYYCKQRVTDALTKFITFLAGIQKLSEAEKDELLLYLPQALDKNMMHGDLLFN